VQLYAPVFPKLFCLWTHFGLKI